MLTPRPVSCEGCPLHITSTSGFCPDKIPDKAEYLFLAEAPGKNEIAQSEPMCVEANTKVLTANLLWVPIRTLQVGDCILTLEETSPYKKGRGSIERRYQIATVTARRDSTKECFAYKTTQGDLLATEDHVVLASPAINKKWSWLPIGKLWANGLDKKSHALCKYLDTWEPLTSYKAGWVAGLFDGEGTISGAKITSKAKKVKGFKVSFCQTEGLVNNIGPSAIRDLGFGLNTSEKKKRKNPRHNTCWNHFVGGDQRDKIRFLGSVRPVRLIQHFQKLVSLGVIRAASRSFRNKANGLSYNKAVLLSRESIGTQHVIDIQTTAGTFLANGFLVHNCGQAGFVLKQWLMPAAIEIKMAYEKNKVGFANVLRCLPKEVQGRAYPRGKDKVAAEAQCRQYDKWPLSIHTVLLFGEHAQRLLFRSELEAEDASDKRLGHDPKGVMGRIGRVYEKDNKRFVFAPHPAFILRQPSLTLHGQRALVIATGKEKILEPFYEKWEDAIKTMQEMQR